MKRRSVLGLAGISLTSVPGCTTTLTGASDPEYDARGIVYAKRIYDKSGSAIGEYDTTSDEFNFLNRIDEDLERRLKRIMPSGRPIEISTETDEELQSLVPGFTYRLYLEVKYPRVEGGDGADDLDAYPFFISRELLNSVRLDQEVGVSLEDRVENAGVSDSEIDLDPSLDTITEIHAVE